MNLVSVRVAADELTVSPWTIKRWAGLGRFKLYKFGPKTFRVDLDEVLEAVMGEADEHAAAEAE